MILTPSTINLAARRVPTSVKVDICSIASGTGWRPLVKDMKSMTYQHGRSGEKRIKKTTDFAIVLELSLYCTRAIKRLQNRDVHDLCKRTNRESDCMTSKHLAKVDQSASQQTSRAR